jgi:geranylgeranyl pyrophosphate synthase
MSTNPSQALDNFLVQCQQRVNNSLQQSLNNEIPSLRLREAMQYACLGGGKRIRPVLVYGSASAVGGELAAADNAACAIELIHCYSLVHDDLPAMDDDDLRRGKPSLHKAFDEATAVLVGDALQSLAFQLLSKNSEQLNSGIQLQMINILSEAAGAAGMAGGQSLDFEASGQNLELAELESLHRLKTGALIKSSVLLGALSCPEVEETQLQALGEFAETIGLAFQVQDDILDETGDTQTLGKPQGSDRALEKPTYVSILGLEAAQSKAVELSNEAVECLSQLSESADRLRDLARYIVKRLH